MSGKKTSLGENMTRRFAYLNIGVTIILFAAIFISIFQFGGKAWTGQTQVALIIPGSKENLGWDRSQYLAVKNVCAESGFEFVLRENVSADFDSCKKITEELAKRGVSRIAFTNGLKLSDVRELEKFFPNITFCTIETISALWTGGGYTIAAFESSYLGGILAGLHTKTNKVGYIAPYADPEVNQGINAFTLGVKRVNPDAEILLTWTGSWENNDSAEQAVQNLKAYRVDVLTYHHNSDAIPNTAERAGINFISFNEVYPEHNFSIGAILIDWKSVYSDLLEYKNSTENSTSYSYGVANGIVDFVAANNSNKISTRERVAIEEAKWEIKHGRLIFSGDIFDRDDVRKCTANEAINYQSLQKNMNWLIKGVRIVGS